MMRQDLDILQELFLPLLEEIAPYSTGLAEDMARGEVFWIGFNGAMLGTRAQLQELLADYGITGGERYSAQFDSLRAEYFAWLAQCFCTGQTNPTITLLLEKGDAAFMEEVTFQKDMLAAIALAGQEAIKNELASSEEFANVDISDEEIAIAFNALHADAKRDELKRQLQQWDEKEIAQPEPARKKRRVTIPLLFLRFAAAAAVGTVAVVGVVKVYNSRDHDDMPAANYRMNTGSNGQAGNLAVTDTTTDRIDTSGHTKVQEGTQNGTAKIPNNTAKKGAEHTAANGAHLPHIILKGDIVDIATNEIVTDVEVTLLDEKGNKQTVFSKNGKFRFTLPLHHDLTITGKKEGYRSARLSLSTKDVQETDADDVIEGTLKLTKAP